MEIILYMAPFLDKFFEFVGVVNNIFSYYNGKEGQTIRVYNTVEEYNVKGRCKR